MRALVGHARRHAIGYLALFVALSGVAYAATKAPKNSVVSKSIKNANVKTVDLRNGAVTEGKLGEGAVTEGKLGVPLDFVPSQDVQRVFMEQVVCPSAPTETCDSLISDRLSGNVLVQARCVNADVDADGGALTVDLTGAGLSEYDGYRIIDSALDPSGIDDGDPVVDQQPTDDEFDTGHSHVTAQASDGHVVNIDLAWSISTFGNGTAVCDIEGTAVSAG